MNSRSAALVFLAACLATRPASAATASTSFSVSVTVQAACLAAPAPITIGTYLSRQWSLASTVSVTCTNPAGYTLGMAQPPLGNGIPSVSAAMAYLWATQPHAYGLTSQRDANFHNVTNDVPPSQLTPPYFSEVPSGGSIIIVVTY